MRATVRRGNRAASRRVHPLRCPSGVLPPCGIALRRNPGWSLARAGGVEKRAGGRFALFVTKYRGNNDLIRVWPRGGSLRWGGVGAWWMFRVRELPHIPSLVCAASPSPAASRRPLPQAGEVKWLTVWSLRVGSTAWGPAWRARCRLVAPGAGLGAGLGPGPRSGRMRGPGLPRTAASAPPVGSRRVGSPPVGRPSGHRAASAWRSAAAAAFARSVRSCTQRHNVALAAVEPLSDRVHGGSLPAGKLMVIVVPSRNCVSKLRIPAAGMVHCTAVPCPTPCACMGGFWSICTLTSIAVGSGMFQVGLSAFAVRSVPPIV